VKFFGEIYLAVIPDGQRKAPPIWNYNHKLQDYKWVL